MRQFASATRALSLYDCSKCLAELEKLPHVHQTSAGVLAMIGKAHYERLDYTSVGLRDVCYLSSGFLSPDVSLLGGTRLLGSSWPGAISFMGHGGVLYTFMAPSAECTTFLSGARAPQHRSYIVTSLDRCGQPVLATKGTITSFNMLSTGCPVGSDLCLCVHPQRTRIY